MTVAVRPGKPNAAASSFMSGIIREPLAGLRATCPVPPETPVALSSPRRTLEGILRAAAVSDAAWGSRTAMNLPALATTPRAMAEAMDRVAGYAASDLIDWTDDPVIGAIVRSWPAQVETPRADALSLRPEASFDDIVREYLDDENGHAGGRLRGLLPREIRGRPQCNMQLRSGKIRKSLIPNGSVLHVRAPPDCPRGGDALSAARTWSSRSSLGRPRRSCARCRP